MIGIIISENDLIKMSQNIRNIREIICKRHRVTDTDKHLSLVIVTHTNTQTHGQGDATKCIVSLLR